MKAEDLVGEYVLRTSPVILNNSIMDLEFTDPIKPYKIIRYNKQAKGITLETRDGKNRIYVTREYDDDNWIAARDYEYKNVKMPSKNYKSLSSLLRDYDRYLVQPPERMGENSKIDSNDDCLVKYCIPAKECFDILEECLNKKNGNDIIIRIVGGNANISRFIIMRYSSDKGLYFMKEVNPANPDIVYCDCNQFSMIIDAMINKGIAVFPTPIIMVAYSNYKCGYSALNNIIDQYRIGYTVQIYSACCVFTGRVLNNGDIEIRLAELDEIDVSDTDNNIVLSTKEAIDLEEKYAKGLRIFSEFSISSK